MTAGRPLLVELFVEELPPKALDKLGRAFAAGIADSLAAQGLTGGSTDATAYASPRRLAVLVPDVAAQAADAQVTHRLMPASVGLADDGTPTQALLKKFAQLGLSADKLADVQRSGEGKAAALTVAGIVPGVQLAAGVQKALDSTLAALPIPTVMQYQLADGWTSVKFVRPAHGLVALHGDDVVPCGVLGLQAGQTTHGHRFEAAVDPVVLRHAAAYAEQLATEGAVIASYADRRAEIERQLRDAADAEGLAILDDATLLDEVTALVERPNVLLCRFDAAFLAVPPECLVLTMKANQKYFPLVEADGALTNKFLVVSNIRPADASAVIGGNERVVRPRLADAQFFFDQDRKRTLESRVEALARVVYQNRLGSQRDRLERIVQIAVGLCALLAPDDAALADRCALAARLAKADLTTAMVGEFPELQGVMGRYYALHDGCAEEVAYAIEDHYRPRFSGDALPRHRVGVVVALADKLETLAGLFGIGQSPTGDKDPYALRRQALGLVRLLVERGLPLSLETAFALALRTMPVEVDREAAAVIAFVRERAKGYFTDQGLPLRAVDAVLGATGGATLLALLPPIVREAAAFVALPDGQALAEANKRIKNILRKSEAHVGVGTAPADLAASPNPQVFCEAAEHLLFDALLQVGAQALHLRDERRYAESLRALIPLSRPVQQFFDDVMVNAEDPVLRANRIALLQHAYAYMNLVADLSLMAA